MGIHVRVLMYVNAFGGKLRISIRPLHILASKPCSYLFVLCLAFAEREQAHSPRARGATRQEFYQHVVLFICGTCLVESAAIVSSHPTLWSISGAIEIVSCALEAEDAWVRMWLR